MYMYIYMIMYIYIYADDCCTVNRVRHIRRVWMRFVHPCMVTLSTSIAINRTHLGKYIICVFCIWVLYTILYNVYIYILYTIIIDYMYICIYIYIRICICIYIYDYVYIYADDCSCRCMIYKYITHKIRSIHHMDMEGKCKRNCPD